MNHLIRLSLLITFLLAAVSCKENPRAVSRLDEAEAMIADMPDSALAILRQHKDYRLNTRSLKARHALLHTIALDKNYIDLTTDSIIAPAVKYYDHKGTSDDRFKTLFYLGRIRQNAGDKEAAMDCFIRATDLVSEVTDTSALARCYAAQGVIYADFYDYPNAIEANRKAAELFLAVGNVNSYVNRILQESFCRWALNDMTSMKECLESIESYKEKFSESTLGMYYSMLILYEMETGNASTVLSKYVHDVPESILNWKIISKDFINKGDYDSAYESMVKYRSYKKDYQNDLGYHAMMFSICDSIGAYKEAIQHYQQYIHLNDSTNNQVYYQNVRLIQDRHEKEKLILETKNNNLILILILICIIGLSVVFALFAIRYIINNKVLRKLYSAAEQEKKSLDELLKSSISISSDIGIILSERMELLNEIVLNQRLSLPAKSNRSKEKIESLLNDTKEYLSTIGMTYVVKNPDVVSFLKSKGLTTWEIGYCCLYVMGYNAKEISGIMQNNQVYKISSEIRKKLGLEGGKIRLETYLKDLFAKG